MRCPGERHSSILADWRASGTQLVEISEILFGHTDYQVLTEGGLSILINRTLRYPKKRVRGEKASEVGNWWKFFYGLQSVSVIGGPQNPTPLPPCW